MGRVSEVQRVHSLRLAGACRRVFLTASLAVSLLVSITGCSTYATRDVSVQSVSLDRSSKEIPEAELVDVRIEVFDPGTLPDSDALSRGLSKDIRKAEAHYIAAQLKTTLQRSGYWGAVRVVPGGTMGAEVTVNGKIVESDGEILALEVSVRDARGVLWFEKGFARVTDTAGYGRAAKNGDEVFQSLYNEIANAIAAHRATLSAAELKSIRQTAELRFASELAPSVFAGYLARGNSAGDGSATVEQGMVSYFTSLQPGVKDQSEFRVLRLPAEDDPMIERIRRIRGRDYLLVDTLDTQYEGVYRDMKDPYTAWRQSRLNEINTIREVDRRANEQMATGVATVVIGVLLGVAISSASNNGGYSSASNIGSSVGGSVAGAAASIGMQQMAASSATREEASLNLQALTESGESFAANVEPFITEVEGETVQLTGTAAGKYAQWRDVLKRINDRDLGMVPAAATKAN